MSAKKIIVNVKPYLESRNRRGTYIDIGANVGLTTKPLIGFFNEIHCFEPNPDAVEQMNNNIDTNLVNVHQLALSNFIGNTELVVPNNKLGHGSIVSARTKKWRRVKTKTHNVDVKTLDSYNFTNVDFIKIDTEQSENDIILGGLKTIEKFFPVIWLENKRQESTVAVKELVRLGYQHKTYKADMMFTKE